MTNTAASFKRDRYVVLAKLLPEPLLAQTYRYACKMAAHGHLLPGDEQVPDTPCGYGDFIMDDLLISLQPAVERASGLVLFPTYSYFRLYKQGDVLARHTDRPSCEISVTVCLGFEGADLWPIWIEGPRGPTSVSLGEGDALLYRGIECAHWRDPFGGDRQAQLFLHYVERGGSNAEWKFDKRESLAEPPPIVSRKLKDQIF